jgi:hypothetical protein
VWNFKLSHYRIDTGILICSHVGVKSSLSLILIAVASLSLTACNNLSTNRALYSPSQPNGPWTKKLKSMQPPPPKKVMSPTNVHP